VPAIYYSSRNIVMGETEGDSIKRGPRCGLKMHMQKAIGDVGKKNCKKTRTKSTDYQYSQINIS